MNQFFARVKHLRPLLWLILLLIVTLAIQATTVTHRARVRGIPGGFPAPVAEANVPTLGVNVALEQYDDEALEAALTRLEAGGFTWVRQPFYWSRIEPEPDRALSTSKGLSRYLACGELVEPSCLSADVSVVALA